MYTRTLTPRDATAYAKLRRFSLTESPFSFSDSAEDEARKTPDDYSRDIQAAGQPLEQFTLGAFTMEQALAGYIRFRRDPRSKARHRASLHSLYVAPAYRGQQVAGRLMTTLVSMAGQIPGLEQLQLSVIISETASLVDFYRKFGFDISGGLIKNDLIINGRYTDAVCMTLYLKKHTP